MSSAGASERSEVARSAARARWEREGNPVVARSVETVVTRADELTGEQLAALADALAGAPGEQDPP
jgi:hypothetical protein